MPTTPNLGLVNVLEGENFDIDVYNGNNDKVDAFSVTIPKKTTLFENANGTSSTIALNDSAANYDSILIDWMDNDSNVYYGWGCKNGSKTRLNSCANGESSAVFRSAIIKVSGTSITFSENRMSLVSEAGYSRNPSPSTIPVKITKVIGVKGF
ncbi:hypothetical protein HOT76_gp26 [Eggerthella phage PMBT5]|uniref:Uncharacterized protein n=1 Tax=Eggerthella phage PMBT5 TaxID=2283015 RepID=A0A345MKE0_9CAUD|nr:hypothetical protein HOT76_gp26 [Eggerthella phage PMBT5]AXH71803.1 fiber lower protein [Eggerthella phage PMBT5]